MASGTGGISTRGPEADALLSISVSRGGGSNQELSGGDLNRGGKGRIRKKVGEMMEIRQRRGS